MTTITPILLAAGASSRMGRPKALLDFDGRCCLELALEAVQGYGTPILVLGPNHEEIRARVPLDPVRVAYNLEVESGQTASLKAGLALLPPEAEAFFFMPVDVPLLTPPDIARLVDAWRSSPDPRRSVFIPSHEMRRGHPVLCRHDLAAEILALPRGASAREVMNREPDRVGYVLYPDAYVLMDMDTPEDYVRCLGAYRARNARNP
ncbi:MAG TPA: nucleotidyltransferase family protein [Planctomycetota bacterium]|nr:nucleotidyltransferase family protein [Planctomycetota bacterium]